MTEIPARLQGAVDLSSLGAPPAPASAATGAPDGSPLVIDVGDRDFQLVLELSQKVPVIIDLWADWCGPCKQLTPILERLTIEYQGRVVLAKVDVDKNPQLAQAFQAQSIPTIAAVIGGRPAPLFSGALPEAEVRDVFEQVLQFAAQQGITGTIPVESGEGAAAPEPEEPPLPPLHQEAYDAIERGDFDAAIQAYQKAVVQNPRDQDAVAGLAQVQLLQRLQHVDANEVRQAAGAQPSDIDAQLAVADLDISGGHIEDAFARLLELFPGAGDRKDDVRLRLLDYFEVVGLQDPRVAQARRTLSTLLY